jgi:hypothetical protein
VWSTKGYCILPRMGIDMPPMGNLVPTSASRPARRKAGVDNPEAPTSLADALFTTTELWMTHRPSRSASGAHKLKAEPAAAAELNGLVGSGIRRLDDAAREELSLESRFDLAYNATHALALAALRSRGYRSESRYLVFSACSTRSICRRSNGGSWTRHIANAISPNMRAR